MEMDAIRELYQQVIIDHGRHPRNFHDMPECTHTKLGLNPLCGDKLVLYIKVNDAEMIEEVSFKGEGCAISMASASLMSEFLKGKTVKEAEEVFKAFHAMATEGEEPDDKLGKLAVLQGVVAYPSRVKCATLAWQTLNAALTGSDETVTTE